MTCSPGPCPRHPPRPPKPPPPRLLAWRWNIGGPITDFGDEGEAGPSRLLCTCREAEEGGHCAAAPEAAAPPSTRVRGRRRTRVAVAATAALALLSLPSVAASPLPTPTNTPTPTVQDIAPRSIHTVPLYTVLTIPDYGPSAVPETVLPMYFTQSDDGHWYRVERAWSLYGRVASQPDNRPSATVAAQSYAVTSQMPPGWGNKSDRSDFYNTPMIVAASVILGIIIVFAIIVITYQRRKEARRKKRHAARMRRKALAAAGLTEDGLKDANSVLEAEFKMRLDELELAHAAKRREKRAQKNQPSAFVRTKVRVWRSTIRRRKSPRTSHDDDDHRIKEHWSPNREYRHSPRRAESPGSLLTRDSASFMTDSSRAPSPHRRALSRAGLGSIEPGTGSETLAETLPSAHSDRTSGEVGGETLSPSTSAHDPTASSASLPAPVVVPGPGGHMPPAYRPASVRSLDLNLPGPSSPRAREQPAMPNVLSPEKASAAGFYPAPATADAELAQSVARRADAKAPIVVPPEEEERRAMHVATDDKRELERMRLGASAPPVNRVEDENGAGPSAPNFEVDGEGFEMLASVSGDEADVGSDAGASSTTSGFGSATSRLTVPGLPAPPRPAALRSLRTFMDDDTTHLRPVTPTSTSPSRLRPTTPTSPAHLRLSAPPSPAHLRPSAPPSPSPSAPPPDPSAPQLSPSAPPLSLEPSAPSAPSAPPLDDFEDDDDGLAPSAPSAPPLDDAGSTHTHSESARLSTDARSHSSRVHSHSLSEDEHEHEQPAPEAQADTGDMHASLNVGGHGFLPRYEP